MKKRKMGHTGYLQTLDLSYNQITKIKGLKKLTNLRNLNLSYNRITEIKGLENLINLKNLVLLDDRLRNERQKLKGTIYKTHDFENLKPLRKLEHISLPYRVLHRIKRKEGTLQEKIFVYKLHYRNRIPNWRPIVEKRPGKITDSKYSGKPMLKKGEERDYEDGLYIVKSKYSGKIKYYGFFLLQINLETIPEIIQKQLGFDRGYLQLYESIYHQGGEPFSSVVRIIHPGEDIPEIEIEEEFKGEDINEKILQYFPKITISDEIFHKLSKDLQDAIKERKTRLRNEETIGYEEYGEEEKEDYLPPLTIIDWRKTLEIHNGMSAFMTDYERNIYDCDKFGGIPDWVQGELYPECPECKMPMQYIFQLSPYENLKLDKASGEVWFSEGVGHIFQCKEHKDVVTFSYEYT